MPEAIATTKRKFYKALDSLSSSSSAPLCSAIEPAAKRFRRSTSTTSSIQPSGLPKTDAVDSRETPNFSPWSHETFLARLKTFSSVSQWHPKPDAINEVEWAKRGWVCVDVNTVGCRGGCERRLVVSLDFATNEAQHRLYDPSEKADNDQEDDDMSLESLLVERCKDEIIREHAESCLWRKAGCKDDIYRLPVVRPSVWQLELRQRYQSLLQMDDAIRDVEIKSLPHDSIHSLPPQKLLDDLPADILGSTGVLEERAKALEIALHGWRGASELGNDLLHCDACFQRVGLWMYQLNYKSASPISADDGSAIHHSVTASLDLLELHRDHCPWRNAETQQASGSFAGLNASQILLHVVSMYAREQRRRSDEQQKSMQQTGVDEEMPEDPAEVELLSRAEVEVKDKERESRLRKLKKLFTIRRRGVKPDGLKGVK